MSTYLDISLPPKRQLRFDEDFAEVFRRLASPSQGLKRFANALHATCVARAAELGALRDPDLRFALSTMLPSRLRSAPAYLRPEAVDGRALLDFLEFTRELGRSEIESAETAEEVATAVIDLLDSVHSYLVAHNLVTREYLAAEHRLAARVLSGAQDTAPAHAPSNGASRDAGKNELAIAA